VAPERDLCSRPNLRKIPRKRYNLLLCCAIYTYKIILLCWDFSDFRDSNSMSVGTIQTVKL
jgi:hypothetical protein